MPSDAFKALVEQLFASPLPEDFPAMREAYLGMGDAFPLPGDIVVEQATIGGCPCEWVTAPGTPANTILLLHGGGFCIGGPGSHRHLAGEVARQTGARVVQLDYRLAPEHPYPAGLDDALATYAALAAMFPGERIALVGDSAGGGLALALLARILRDGLHKPASVYCMSPWADLTDRASSRTGKAALDPLASSALLNRMAQAYAGGTALDAPEISPVFADFRGAPPVLIQVGTAEVLMDDSINLAKALGDADVDVDLDIRAGMIHVWPWFAPAIPEGQLALGRACQFLKANFG